MKLKIVLWSVVAILILGLAGGAFWWLRRPQVITFDSGDKLTLLAVDYGKRHMPPGVKSTSTNPTSRPRGGAFNTPTDTLVLWVRQEHQPNQYANFQYYIYDKAETAVASYSGMNSSGGNSQSASQVVAIQFSAFPRRQGKFILRAQENSNTGQEMSDQKFVIANPARGPFEKWTADALPDAQADDDLSVTLTKLVAGADSNVNRDQDNPDDPLNKGVQATFNVTFKGKPATNWQPMSIETSDATGNHVNGFVSQNQWSDNEDLVTYQFGLWPDEAAWKLRAEFSKQTGFDDGELWSVSNIPLQPGKQQDFNNYGGRRGQANSNAVFAETDLNGFHLKIYTPKQFTDAGQNAYLSGGLTIQVTPTLASGMRLTVVKLTDDQTNDIENMNQGTFGDGKSTTYRYGLRNMDGVTNLNLTLALHQSHFVEFTVKPDKAPAAAAQ